MTDTTDRARIVERLQSHAAAHSVIYNHGGICGEALDLIEQDGKKIADLNSAGQKITALCASYASQIGAGLIKYDALDRIASDLQALCDQQAVRIAEVEAERDALRAEVEALRAASR